MRTIALSGMLLLVLCTSAWSQAKPTLAAKPSVTLTLPTIDALYEDLELAFKLSDNPKEFKTLKETINVFLKGIDTDVPSTVRVYLKGGELPYVLSVPLKNAAALKEFRSNLWDLDVKTYEPPQPALIRSVPQTIKKKVAGLGLAKNAEFLIFNLYEGFMRYEQAAGQAHVGVNLEEVRHVKGGAAVADLKGHDVLIVIDGAGDAPEARLASFATAKKEVLGAIVKGEKESEADFEARKAVAEHQVAEVERFFSESSKIELAWTTSAAEKNARFSIDLGAVAGTSLDQSLKSLGESPDEFAAVGDTGAVLKLSINFPLDALRKQHLQSITAKSRISAKAHIDGNDKQTEDQKGVERDMADLGFDIVDDLGKLGIINGFIRSWPNGDGTLTTVGGMKVPDGAKVMTLLQKFSKHGAAASVEEKVDSEGEVAIHKLTLKDLHKDYPELIPGDGTVYVGTSSTSAWFALGDQQALPKLKEAIKEAKSAEPKAGPAIAEFKATLLPFVEIYDKVETRKKPVAEPKKPGEKKVGDKKTGEKKAQEALGILSDLQLPKVAIDAFKKGHDTFSLSLVRDGDNAKVTGQLDEGLLRFVGMAAAKFVKENLGED